jgi:hypothetical protein
MKSTIPLFDWLDESLSQIQENNSDNDSLNLEVLIPTSNITINYHQMKRFVIPDINLWYCLMVGNDTCCQIVKI